VNVTEPATALVAVTVLGPGVDPRMRTVLAVAAVVDGPTVWLTGGEKLSPGALLVQLTEPQGPGMTTSGLQLTDTTKVLPFAERKAI
jgi:hypothetical protein